MELTPEEARELLRETWDGLIVQLHMIVWGLGLYLRLWK